MCGLTAADLLADLEKTCSTILDMTVSESSVAMTFRSNSEERNEVSMSIFDASNEEAKNALTSSHFELDSESERLSERRFANSVDRAKLSLL